jgi:S-methylmethionine-dependent homocysteine/selenocysteine methylase
VIEDTVEEWISIGARFVGGCCRTNADHIKKIKEKVVSLRT